MEDADRHQGDEDITPSENDNISSLSDDKEETAASPDTEMSTAPITIESPAILAAHEIVKTCLTHVCKSLLTNLLLCITHIIHLYCNTTTPQNSARQF